MIKSDKESYFSISASLILVGVPITYSLYINVSGDTSREHFIRIFPEGGTLTQPEIEEFKKKYHQLYVPERQRSAYMDGVIRNSGKPIVEKAAVLKDSAIHYLDNLFAGEREMTTEILNQSISGCRDVVANMVDVIQSYDIDQLQEMIAKLSFHDFYTYDHSINVSMYCVVIYRLLFPDATKVEIIQAGLGGMLHDLGKIKIPTQIINKATKLSDEELLEIKNHPDYGLQFLSAPGVKLPDGVDPTLVRRVVHEHHENFDGTGYPAKLSNNQIHLLARITAVADFFDAITTKRTYHNALPIDEALALMQKAEGKKIDPKIFKVFATHTRNINANYQSSQELPGNFDPCQPHQHLPFKTIPSASPQKTAKVLPKGGDVKGLLENLTQGLVALDKAPHFDPPYARSRVESALELGTGLYPEQSFAPLVHELFKAAKVVTLKMVGTSPKLKPILARIKVDEMNYTATHSLLFAELSCAIASKVGWESESTFSKLIIAAFLHDVALANHRIAKFQTIEDLKKDGHFTESEIEIFRAHPDRAATYVRGMVGTPAEVEGILVQHHEQADGKGFPNGRVHTQLSPLSCLFILAQELLNYFLVNGKEAKLENWIQLCMGKYKLGVFKKIIKSINVSE